MSIEIIHAHVYTSIAGLVYIISMAMSPRKAAKENVSLGLLLIGAYRFFRQHVGRWLINSSSMVHAVYHLYMTLPRLEHRYV